MTTQRVAHLLTLATTSGLRIVTAESCTSGLLSAALTELPGSSAIFDRGFAVYSNAAKETVLGVSSETLHDFGAVSEQAAQEMAQGALNRSDADIAIAITGISGPGGSDFKPEGRVCFGLARIGFDTRCLTVDFGALGRQNVRLASVAQAIELLIGSLEDHPAP